ncbi:ATP-binding protein [Herbidospora mongoliensis]|uniref:ATP-binding protein n=1 Tax=Herbidospora mongoliensis TaxID=688067 RepID=UPI00082D49C7|nr:ATP-binding protein [Herbidospora mongoliensis]
MTNVPRHWPITDDLSALRDRVGSYASGAGLSTQRAQDLELAVSEAAANVLEHGGGHGTLSIWADELDLTVEIADTAGRLAPHHAYPQPPSTQAPRGFGLWLMGQVCDEISIDQQPGGSRLRLRMALTPAPNG